METHWRRRRQCTRADEGIVSTSGLLRVAAKAYYQIAPNFENARLQTERSAEDESDIEKLRRQRVERGTAGSVGEKIGNCSDDGHGKPWKR